MHFGIKLGYSRTSQAAPAAGFNVPLENSGGPEKALRRILAKGSQ